MDIIEINRRQVFSLMEAQEILPVILKITKDHSTKVNALIERIESLGVCTEDKGVSVENLVASLEEQVNQTIQEWQCKIQKLGGLPKGLWLADFDAGDGYFCWKFPERSIEFWHTYNDGYSKRVPVSDLRRPASFQDRLRRKIFPLVSSPILANKLSGTGVPVNFKSNLTELYPPLK
jgi:hypothetical protein